MFTCPSRACFWFVFGCLCFHTCSSCSLLHFRQVLVEEVNPKQPKQLVGRNPHSRLVYFDGNYAELKVTHYSFIEGDICVLLCCVCTSFDDTIFCALRVCSGQDRAGAYPRGAAILPHGGARGPPAVMKKSAIRPDMKK